MAEYKKTYMDVDGERFALFTGITSVYGGWLPETSGEETHDR